MKDAVRKLLSLVLLAVFLGSSVMFALDFFDKQESTETYLAAQELAGLSQEAPAPTEPAQQVTEPTAPPQTETPAQWVPAPVEGDPYIGTLRHTDLEALRQVNPEVVGWIRIPGADIHYPITQGEDNQYYLTHTWDHERNYSGAIFLETQNAPDFTDFNTIIYGHNMRNGSMFAPLHDYADLSFWEQNPYVYLVTDSGVLRYEIFSSYHADVDSQTYGLSFRQTETKEKFIAMALENSELSLDITPAVTDRILTLSTCTGLGYAQRRVVHAYLPMVQVQ